MVLGLVNRPSTQFFRPRKGPKKLGPCEGQFTSPATPWLVDAIGTKGGCSVRSSRGIEQRAGFEGEYLRPNDEGRTATAGVSGEDLGGNLS